MMRLRILLFALALAVQALAPVVSGAAAGENARIGLGEICFKVSGNVDHDGRAAPGHSHHRDCPVCQAFCDGVAPVETSVAVLAASPPRWETLRWRVGDNHAPAAMGRLAHRARAPPVA